MDDPARSSLAFRLARAGRLVLGDMRGRALWVVLGCLICQFGPGFGYAIGAIAHDMLAELGWSMTTYASMQGLPRSHR